MKSITVQKKEHLKGEFFPPGDKSISHRAIICGSIARGKTRVTNFCPGEDTARTVETFRSLGVNIDGRGSAYLISGNGLHGLREPSDVLYAGNSGTTTRLMTGLLSGQKFFSVITGDESLRTRPMRRVTEPLRAMGAKIDGRGMGDYAPLAIRGTALSPLTYESPVASAQVKSAILLGGLYAEGVTQVTEPSVSRDHTERMLKAIGADIKRDGAVVRISGFPTLEEFSLHIPGDISSAAFLIVGAILLPGSRVTVRNVGTNPLRTGVLEALKAMGANVVITNLREELGEPIADVVVTSSPLKSIEISGEMVPRIIDEIPILAVAAAHAEGTTIVRGAKELRVKETDRITATVEGLRRFGVTVEEFDDGMAITGGRELKGAVISSYGDHRTAMAFIIAGLTASGTSRVEDTESIATSFPNFMELLESLSG